MTKARDFLADNGLAIRGARGKFSKEAKAFLAKAIETGETFEDWNENGRIIPVHTPRVPKSTVARRSVGKAATPSVVRIREENVISLIDDRGTLINVGQCSQGHAISRCTCATIKPAAYFNAQDWEIIVKR